jgi:solute:Na+ symporter, SSS family
MSASRLVIFAYLLANLGIGFFLFLRARRASRGIREGEISFFLADRGLGTFALFFTLMATNFSAFTVFGLSGAGFRTGYAYYPLIGLGTGLMAASFFLVGVPLRRLAAERGFVTQGDFIAHRYGSKALGKAFSVALIAITLPYLSIQASSGGMILQEIAGIPYRWGAFLIVLFILAYSLLGGMRSVVWTDVLQGIFLLGLSLLGMGLIAWKGGGWLAIHGTIRESAPGLYSLPGEGGGIRPSALLGYFLLWFLADPTFPQLFQRFIAGKNDHALKRSAVVYPLVCGILFLCTISIGVMGRALLPALDPSRADSVYPLMLAEYFPPWLAALIALGGIAALMSTMDSQMLTVGSMAVRDFLPQRLRTGFSGRLALCLIALASYLLSLKPPVSIFDFLQKISFNGYASLAPAIFGGLYWKKANRRGAFLSAAAGFAASALSGFGLLRVPFPSVFLIAGASCLGLILGSLVFRSDGTGKVPEAAAGFAPRNFFSTRSAILTCLIAAAAFLPYLFRGAGPILLGLPAWVWYEFLLSAFLSLVFWAEARAKSP